jgi:hypothetical protein
MFSVTEASAFDVAELLGDAGQAQRVGRTAFGRYARQVAGGASCTIRDEAGQLVAMAGLWAEAGFAEAWFGVGPGARGHLVRLVRLLGRLMVMTLRDAGVHEVRAFIHPDSVAGARLAARLGFSHHGTASCPLGDQAVFVRRIP